MVFVIVLLYLMTTVSFALLWFFVQFGFIDNGQDAPSVFTALTSFNSQWTITQIGMGVAGTISTVISDGTLVSPYQFFHPALQESQLTDHPRFGAALLFGVTAGLLSSSPFYV